MATTTLYTSKFRSIFHKIKPFITGMIIHKDYKIARASYGGRWRWSPNIKVNKIKRSMKDRFTKIKWQDMMFFQLTRQTIKIFIIKRT